MKNPRKTRQRRDLTLEKIIESALDVLNSNDPSALTMRRVAENCGVSAMAIYHHINNKDQLAKMAVDSIFLTAAQTERNGSNWKEKYIDLWCVIRAKLLLTPGAGMIWVRQAVLGPGTASATEQMFKLLKEGGLSGSEIAEANDAMTMLSIGSVANDLTRPARIRMELGRQLAVEEAPLLNENINIYAQRDGEERYQLALNWILDGVARR